jgi:hypothetical protein
MTHHVVFLFDDDFTELFREPALAAPLRTRDQVCMRQAILRLGITQKGKGVGGSERHAARNCTSPPAEARTNEAQSFKIFALLPREQKSDVYKMHERKEK